MQAAVMYGPEDIRVEEVPKPKCPEDGLLLKVQSVGLCGSSKHVDRFQKRKLSAYLRS